MPQEIYQIPVSSPANHVTYVTVEDNDDEWVTLRRRRRLHRHDGRLGLHGVGLRLVLPAVRRVWRLLSATTTRTSRPTATPPGTTRGPAPTGAAPASTVRMAAPASARATTRAPEPTRAAPPPTVRTARAASRRRYNPRTGTYAQTRQGSNVYGSWGSTAGAARRRLGEDQSLHEQPDRHHDAHRSGPTKASAVTRRGPDGGAVAAAKRRQRLRRQGRQRLSETRTGRGRSYDNGGWSNTRNQAAGGQARSQRDAIEQRAGTSSVDRSTTDQLNRDVAAARHEGTQRHAATTGTTGAAAALGARTGRLSRGGGGGARSAAAAAAGG